MHGHGADVGQHAKRLGQESKASEQAVVLRDLDLRRRSTRRSREVKGELAADLRLRRAESPNSKPRQAAISGFGDRVDEQARSRT